MGSNTPRLLWKRLPTYFPNIKLVMYAPAQSDLRRAHKEGYLRQARFPSLYPIHGSPRSRAWQPKSCVRRRAPGPFQQPTHSDDLHRTTLFTSTASFQLTGTYTPRRTIINSTECCPSLVLQHDRTQPRKQELLLQASFRTTPEVTKHELREFFEKVYGVPVLRVDTVVVQGRVKSVHHPDKKRPRTMKESDYKKAWVQFAPGTISALKEAPKHFGATPQSAGARSAVARLGHTLPGGWPVI